MTDLSKTYIYRITHIENIPHILENGITRKDSPKANKNYVNIGDVSLINTRNEKQVIVDNGKQGYGDAIIIKLGDFIPFYFGYRMPMLFVIQKGYNGVTRQFPENIVYCVSTVQKIINEGLDFYFTDGHAINQLSSCYDSTMADSISEIIDFKATKAPDWAVTRDLKRKKEAEFLISGDIPAKCLVGFICYNSKSKSNLKQMNIAEEKIHINPQYYF